MTPRYDCRDVDELAGALALGAVDAEEARAAREHLGTCAEPHAELRSLLGADAVLAAGLEPIQPSAGLRDRLMESIGQASRTAEPQVARGEAPAQPARRGWLDWLSPQLARPVAVAAVVAALAFGAWGVSLSGQLSERDRALRAVADAIAGGEVAYRVEGDAGRGYVVDTPGSGAAFVVADVTALDADKLYELWLIGADGEPVDVGTFRPSGVAVAVIPVEEDLAGFGTFAVTVESERVDSPTLPIVMAGEIAS
ncbi:MAG TPA: anti-sigma factor [Candidatus Limnocylindria bacterium]|nr:anti-sigma factor [Candidatus Limnocylindria bacterium]